MDKLIPVKIPLLNPNEPEALLVDLIIPEGARVTRGEVIALIETTKSTGEICAERDGYLVGVLHEEGATLRAGQTLAYIADSPTAKSMTLPPWSDETGELSSAGAPPEHLRITEPARQLALEMGIDLQSLPQGTLVTRQMVMAQLAPKSPIPASEVPQTNNRLIIYGAGGHGRSLAALVEKAGFYQIVGFLDDGDLQIEKISGLDLLGGADQLQKLAEQDIRRAINGVGGIGNLEARLSVYDRLSRAGFHCPTVIHPTSFLEESVELEDGNQVFPFAYLGTHVQVGFGCIVNTGAIVSHDCILDAYVNLSPGATLAGGVHVGEGALIGMRATVNLDVQIGRRAQIGNGATVKADVPAGGVVPAGTIWPPRG